MAYILGFLYADGNIIETKRGTHFTAFYSADECLIRWIHEVIKSEHKISSRTKSGSINYKIQIGSKEWFKDLERLGLIPNKAKRMRMPDVPKMFVGDFIRGYFDGDGNIWSGPIHMQREKRTLILMARFTSCSEKFLEDVLLAIRRRGVRNGKVHHSKKGNFSRLTLGTRDSLKLYEIMYNSPCSMYLERKRIVFERFIRMRV